MLLLSNDAFSAESYFPSLLPGASQFDTENTSPPDLLVNKWAQYEWVSVVKEYRGSTRYVMSCVELDTAHQNGEYAPDTAGMGREQQQMEYCQNIRRLILAKPARHSAFVFPLCLEMPLYLKLGKALKSSLGADGLLRIEKQYCRNDSAQASVSYDRIIAPANELGDAVSDGVVYIRYLVQGDFDNDGWLDLIADVGISVDFNHGENAVHGVVKISLVKDVLTVTKFEDL